MAVTTLYVGNLPWSTSEDEIRKLVAKVGAEVLAVRLVRDEEGRSKGYAFVEVSSGAEAVIEALNEQELAGRPLRISVANRQKGARGW